MSHRYIRPVLACAVVLALSGCQFGSDTDRIDDALPPGAEFPDAKGNLFAVAKVQGLDVEALGAELDPRIVRSAGPSVRYRPEADIRHREANDSAQILPCHWCTN